MEEETPSWLKNYQRGLVGASGDGAKNHAKDDRGNAKAESSKARRRDAVNRGHSAETMSLDPTDDTLLAEPPVAKKLQYEEFARSFLIDFNQTRAAIRMGYPKSSASVNGSYMFWQPFTQAYLVQLIRSLEEHTIVTRNEVLTGLLREAHRFDMDASSASRISAWREIGKILGMYVQRIELSANSSGVMEVPMVSGADQWETLAVGSQTKLLEAVRA